MKEIVETTRSSPFFSVITPSFNQGPYLTTCLESVKQQGVDDYEHILFDNCSTDESKNILEEWSQDPHLAIFIEPDHGQSEAVNKGFQKAQGEIICWLNSDDAYAPDTFHQLRNIFQNPEIDVVFGDVMQLSYGPKTTSERAVAQFLHREDFIRWWDSRVKLHQPAIFFRRSVMETIGLLKEQWHYAMDYEYWWRMAEKYQFHYIPAVFAIQHRQPDSKTIKAWSRVLEEREKIFAPYYPLLKEKFSALQQERAKALAQHYLLQAYAVVETNQSLSWDYFKKAWKEAPQQTLKRSSWGLIRRLLFNKQ